MGYKWQQLGGKVYLDTNINLVHVGAKDYQGNVAEWLKNWKIKFENETPSHPPDDIQRYFKLDDDDDTFKVL
jgi:hypothetical protein